MLCDTYRVVQSLASVLLRVYPERARTERERIQADEIYTAGRDIPVCPFSLLLVITATFLLTTDPTRSLHPACRTPMFCFLNSRIRRLTTLPDRVLTGEFSFLRFTH